MKLKDWSNKVGVNYLTCYRWFKAGTLPVKAYQTDSGTIIVDDEEEINDIIDSDTSPAFSLFLKKVVEYSANQSSIEDFAAFIISNFKLKLIGQDQPKYSKNKPETKEIQNHYKQMISNMKKEKPAPCMYFPTNDVLENIEKEEVVISELENQNNKQSLNLNANEDTATNFDKDLQNVSESPVFVNLLDSLQKSDCKPKRGRPKGSFKREDL